MIATGALAALLVVAAAEGAAEQAADDEGVLSELEGLVLLGQMLWASPGGEDPCATSWNCLAGGDTRVYARAALRAGYEFIQPSERVGFVGHNDGFRLDQARFGFTLESGGHWRVQLIADAARVLPGGEPNDPVRTMTLALSDAYVEWRPLASDFAFRVGQQRMPGDVEGMTARGKMLFATRSVAGSGVEPGRGFQVDGLGTGSRDLGLVVADVLFLPFDFYLAYAAGVGNGNGANVTANDNLLPAGYLRLHAGYDDVVRVAMGGKYNPRTVGRVPVQQDESDATGFLEGSAAAFGFDLLAIGYLQHVTFDSVLPDVSDPNRARLGYGLTSWIVAGDPFGLPTYGLRAGYRVSFLEQAIALPDESLLEHSVALRYDPDYLPHTAFVVDFTSLWSFDHAGLASLGGNRVFALVHVEL